MSFPLLSKLINTLIFVCVKFTENSAERLRELNVMEKMNVSMKSAQRSPSLYTEWDSMKNSLSL